MSMTDSPSALAVKKSKKDQFFVTEEYQDAIDELPINTAQSIATLLNIVKTPSVTEQQKVQTGRMKEEAIYILVKEYLKANTYQAIQDLFIAIRPYFDEISKPRSAKIIRTIIDMVIDSNTVEYKDLITLVLEAIQWSIDEKRVFVRQRLQAKLAQLYALNLQYRDALLTIRKLMKEIKKIEDKPLIVDVQLIESQMYFRLKNYPKSRGALTMARATATGFYCPPLTTAQIELQAGMLSCREKDYPTAESYFHEAVDNFLIVNKLDDAIIAFKYMLFCKILNDQAGEVSATIQQRAGVNTGKSNDKNNTTTTTTSTNNSEGSVNSVQANAFLNNTHILAMEQLSIVYQTKKYHNLDQLFNKYPVELLNDTLINDQLETLRENLLENSIKRIVSAYTRIDIQYIAQQLNLPRDVVENKLSQLILDEKLSAQLDHSFGDLLLIEKYQPDELFTQSSVVLQQMNVVVDKLTTRMDRVLNPPAKTEEKNEKEKEEKIAIAGTN